MHKYDILKRSLASTGIDGINRNLLSNDVSAGVKTNRTCKHVVYSAHANTQVSDRDNVKCEFMKRIHHLTGKNNIDGRFHGRH